MIRKFTMTLAAWLLCMPIGAALAQASQAAPEAPLTSGIQTADIDPSIRPQDDLFGHANGTWLKKTPIPDDRSSYGVDEMMAERSLLQQRELIETAQQSSNPEERKVGDLYTSFMDEQAIEHLGIAPLQADLDSVNQVKSVADLGALMGFLSRLSISAPVTSYVEVDARHSSRYALYLQQGGLGLPDRDYFLSKDKKLVAFRTQYREHIENMLRLLGDADASAEAEHIVALETAMAKVQWTRVEERDPIKVYNAKSLEQLSRLAPSINWQAYLSSLGVSGTPTLVIRQPSYVVALSGLVKTTPLPLWKEYFRYRILSARAKFLPAAFVTEDFAFNRHVLRGTPQNTERWKRGAQLVDESIGEESGKLYVAKYFPPETKARIDTLVTNLIKAYGQSLDQLDWMAPQTKPEAHAKLDKINIKIGYPAVWRDYSALVIKPDDLMGNVDRSLEFENHRKLKQLLGPVDHTEWDMTAPTVNAYYSPEMNEVVFPAGILQAPAFDPKADDAFNYGSTGATIGHELSHGFDDEGSQYDSDGNLRDWWTKADHARFAEKTKKLIAEYNGFEPVPGFHINGALTLGENIADIAGIEIAYKAYIASLNGQPSPVIDGLTGDQRFYLGFAQSWLGKDRDAALISQLKSDPHSPEKYRVNGVVVHMPSFYTAFSVEPGDKMYLAPDSRVTLW